MVGLERESSMKRENRKELGDAGRGQACRREATVFQGSLVKVSNHKTAVNFRSQTDLRLS